MTAVFISLLEHLIFGGSKWAKWPLQREALTHPKRPEKGERHAFISPSMKRWSVP